MTMNQPAVFAFFCLDSHREFIKLGKYLILVYIRAAVAELSGRLPTDCREKVLDAVQRVH